MSEGIIPDRAFLRSIGADAFCEKHGPYKFRRVKVDGSNRKTRLFTTCEKCDNGDVGSDEVICPHCGKAFPKHGSVGLGRNTSTVEVAENIPSAPEPTSVSKKKSMREKMEAIRNKVAGKPKVEATLIEDNSSADEADVPSSVPVTEDQKAQLKLAGAEAKSFGSDEYTPPDAPNTDDNVQPVIVT